ncbi:aldo/keto reductase family oxidoreductase (macronuclear) [Tetrahymena thermophila SB210]|uniref:Aldo/keto reductase family oxidoreductase n=1 Tax=Tetrahymena thermophila (strain SB210) TaxID=312017 RepID=I7MCV7_TETTS|nr:aldo/keto reductase family oxidoreductase [Tetrahymena thermophila SB210]EAR85009.1 aldo/keto reductase family oxidoreductase [Tetrahymena thermophila SB210]|eukprot:XP_001032672.1 aldo/keto reductase family oxidoreductase [Tetrahymena thermophila SB210]
MYKNIFTKFTSSSSIQLSNKVKQCFSLKGHTIDIQSEHNLIQRKSDFEQLYKVKYTDKLVGYATAEGTKKYSELKKDSVDPTNFSTPFKSDLTLSSIGFGSYQGTPDKEDDMKMFNALIDSVNSGGINVIDTALNFRYQKSERSIGAALRYLKNQNKITRDQYFLASKGGFLVDDADQGIPSTVLINNLIQKKLITEEDIIGACHCMNPNYLSQNIDQSLDNLGVETLDLYYLQNASEVQMPLIGEDKFFEKLSLVFELFEKKIQENKIRNYGLATWLAFRSRQDEKNIHLNLQKVVKLAEKVGGKNHGLRYIQLPVNVMMPESFSEKWQNYENEKGEVQEQFLLKVARELQVNIITSSPLMQGAMINCPLPKDVFQCVNQGAKHLQFVRSIPSPAIISTLIGQKSNRNVKKNLEVIVYPKLSEDKFWEFLIPSKREQEIEETVNIS